MHRHLDLFSRESEKSEYKTHESSWLSRYLEIDNRMSIKMIGYQATLSPSDRNLSTVLLSSDHELWLKSAVNILKPYFPRRLKYARAHLAALKCRNAL